MFKGGMGNMMKQAQQMQERMQQAQEEIANMEVTGEAGAGMVKVTMLGNHNVKRVSICLLYTSPSPRDATLSRMPSSA